MTLTATDTRAELFQRCRRELVTYATRMTLREDVAEELVQEAAVRLLQTDSLPDTPARIRAWLFRVTSNLAIDHLRRHSTWREMVLIDARDRAEGDPAFVAQSVQLRATPEMSAIAREHLAVCFVCTLRNLPPLQAAALLLREVHGFSTAEAAEMLESTPIQIKNSIQQARKAMNDRYGCSCALVAKQGVCHQCVELDGFFNGRRRDPLTGTKRDLAARLKILKETREAALGPWHRRLFRLVEDLLKTESGI